VAQLCQRQADFSELGAEIVVISFGPGSLARAWLDETGSPLRLFLDPKREAYRAYGLEYSLARSWGPRAIWTYARLLLRGRRWRGIQGDSGQLGGDFVVDRQGILRLAYRSKDPADRPSVESLLAALRQIEPAPNSPP
jgi:peroxiredoxin